MAAVPSQATEAEPVPVPVLKKRATRRKPGLLFPTMKVEIQTVSKGHKLPCCECSPERLPIERRLFVKYGSGRHQTSEVRCKVHGTEWLRHRGQEITRAIQYLSTGEGECRL